METQQIKFAEGQTYEVQFKFDTPKTGTNQHGEWNLYGVTHNGVDSSFFASPGLHRKIQGYGQGDTCTIKKVAVNGKIAWDIKTIGNAVGKSANNTSPDMGIDARTKDIHRQVCLKLAVESIGTKAKVTEAYYKDVKARMEGLLNVLDPEDVMETIKDKFDGEDVTDKGIPF